MNSPESFLNVTGATAYLDDLPVSADCLFAVPIVSPCAHGRLKKIDIQDALLVDPELVFVTAKDIPGVNQIGETVADEPLLVEEEWTYQGQCLAILLSADRARARRAAQAVHIEHEVLPVITDPREAARKGYFIMPSRTMACGDIHKALSQCAFVVEGCVDSGAQEHIYLETQGAIAHLGGDGKMHITSSSQSPSQVQHVAARVLDLWMNEVEVEVLRLGGGFGGKEDQAALWASLAALGAYRTRKQVKLYLDRRSDIRYTGKRHPYSTDFRIGMDAQGKLLVFEAEYFQNSGACCDLSPAILSRSLFHATAAYHIPNVTVTGHMCRTNLPPFTAFRGFGAPQAYFVIESAMDALARSSGRDPIELRRNNLRQDGDVFHFGQKAESCRALSCFDRLNEMAHLSTVRKSIAESNARNPHIKHGLAVTPICFGVSFTKLQMNQGGSLVHVYHDGTVSVATGAVEMGQQVARKIQKIAATTLGIDESRIRVDSTRSSTVANTSPTAASTGSDINGMAAMLACEQIKQRLLQWAADNWKYEKSDLGINQDCLVHAGAATRIGWEELVAKAYVARIDLSAHGFYATPGLVYDAKKEWGAPFAYHVYGCAAVLVALDVVRGTYHFEKVWVVHDSGKSIDEKVDIGQIEGGIAQGLGWAALEDLCYDAQGKILTDNLATYKIPDIHFMPEIEIEFLSGVDNPRAVLHSKAIGEPPLLYGIAGYFAILDAVRAMDADPLAAVTGSGPLDIPERSTASGLYSIPMTSEKVLDLIETMSCRAAPLLAGKASRS